jgi:molybdate transport system regulatory protein
VKRHARGPTKLRVMFGAEIAIGPGKAELLEAIEATGSISASAKRLGCRTGAHGFSWTP